MSDAFSRILSTLVKAFSVVLALALGAEHVFAQTFRMEIGCPNQPTKKIEGLTRNITLDEWKRTLTAQCGQEWQGYSPDQPKRDPAPNRRFTIRDAGDINGGDLGRPLSQLSYEQCISACQGEGRCVGFAYDRFNRYCFLKDSIVGPLRYDPSSTLGVLTSESVTSSRAARVIEIFRDAVFYDQSYKDFATSSFENCKNACENDIKCEVFSFMNISRVCRLIQRPLEYCRRKPRIPSEYCRSRQYISADSGVKRQLD